MSLREAAAARPAAIGAVLRIPLDRIRDGHNARGALGDITDLAMSIATIGQQVPAIVADNADGTFTLLEGHRRHAACQLAKLPTLDAVVRAAIDEPTRLIGQLAIHTGVRTFDPIAEANALHQLLFVHRRRHEDVARAVGHTQKWVSDRLALLNLTEAEQADVVAGRTTVSHALAIVSWRRAAREGRARPIPQTRVMAAPRAERPRPHCSTCTCEGIAS